MSHELDKKKKREQLKSLQEENARLRAALSALLCKLDDHSEATPISYFADDREKARAALEETE
jgi:hypothetical protein